MTAILLLALSLLGAGHAAPPEEDPHRRTAVVRAVERVAPSVVSITTEARIEDPFQSFFGRRRASGEGSGVVIDEDGVVLTNAHVVDGAQRILATSHDGQEYEASVLGLDPDLDLAVLRLQGAEGLVAVEPGDSARLMLGEPVIAIGNPLGLGHTVTTGVISAVSRPVRTDRHIYQDFIQTDASINPGNSGGPLLDAHGRLIGIATAIRTDAQNIGFAIPANRALKIARDLVSFGSVRLPWLGLDLTDVHVDREGRTAPRVERVWPGSSAAEAGLAPGDLLLTVDGRSIQGRGDLNAYLAAYEPGREVRITWRRGTSEQGGDLRGGTLPEEVVDVVLREMLGVEVAARGKPVVTSITPGGAFARAGLHPGDVVVAVNAEPVESLETFRSALARVKSGHRTTVTLTVRRGQAWARFSFGI